MQAVDELDLSGFRYGGVNITGFRLVDNNDPAVQSVHSDWVKLYPDIMWKPAAKRLTVRLTLQVFFRLLFKMTYTHDLGSRGLDASLCTDRSQT